MHENHASIVALHRLKTFFKKSADTFASTQYFEYVAFTLFSGNRSLLAFANDCQEFPVKIC